MKIWTGYGSEHSMNLVMIGHFKEINEAKKVKDMIDTLTHELADKIDIDQPRERFGDDVQDLMIRLNCSTIRPRDLEQFLFDHQVTIEGTKITLTTEEADVSAFLKLMVENGAKVEVFSAHDYPEED